MDKSFHFINCYNECNYNYYLNGSDYYICTQNENCLDNYNELFEEQVNYIRENCSLNIKTYINYELRREKNRRRN